MVLFQINAVGRQRDIRHEVAWYSWSVYGGSRAPCAPVVIDNWFSASFKHPEHWAEHALRTNPLRRSQCFVLIKRSDSHCQFRLWTVCTLYRRKPHGHKLQLIVTIFTPMLYNRYRIVYIMINSQTTTFHTQPSEPIRVPKVMIFVADFPHRRQRQP